MYRYDEYDQRLVDERVEQFRGQVHRYLAGETPEDEFKGLRLRNGRYYQRHAYMLRVAVPYGTQSDRICCPGLDFCSLANAGSIDVAHQVNDRFDEQDQLYDNGLIELKMSGCMLQGLTGSVPEAGTRVVSVAA